MSPSLLSLPVAAADPLQSPDLVQDVGVFVADHATTESPPVEIADGVAVMVTTGAVTIAGGMTFTATERLRYVSGPLAVTQQYIE